MNLKLGNHGDLVKHVQQQLRHFEPALAIDGIFGRHTDRAVRIAQRRLGLYPPDGIVGPITASALTRSAAPAAAPTARPSHPAPAATGSGDPGPLRHAVEPARRRARQTPMPPGMVSPVSAMTTSRFGRQFIVSHEAQANVSNHLHHPSAGSGVTIGPGYDMKDRSKTAVAADLRAIGVAPADAAAAAEGAGKSGTAAGTFVRDNKTLLNLTREQERALLDHIIPHYEAMVKGKITVPLHQQEFDALQSGRRLDQDDAAGQCRGGARGDAGDETARVFQRSADPQLGRPARSGEPHVSVWRV